MLRDGRATTAAYTGPLAADLDEVQYGTGHGPCLDAAVGGEAVEIVDARAEDRWPDDVPAFLERGALSCLAVPVPAAHLSAGLNLYASAAHAFSETERGVLVDVAAFAGAALSNLDSLQDARSLARDLQAAMDFRSVIEQAKGILMERYKVSADEAFRILAASSMRTNHKVREIAETLVLTGALAHRDEEQS
jgi:GAF domain-containing protein